MIVIDETKFGIDNHCRWLLSDEDFGVMSCALEQLFAQMMSWA